MLNEAEWEQWYNCLNWKNANDREQKCIKKKHNKSKNMLNSRNQA